MQNCCAKQKSQSSARTIHTLLAPRSSPNQAHAQSVLTHTSLRDLTPLRSYSLYAWINNSSTEHFCGASQKWNTLRDRHFLSPRRPSIPSRTVGPSPPRSISSVHAISPAQARHDPTSRARTVASGPTNSPQLKPDSEGAGPKDQLNPSRKPRTVKQAVSIFRHFRYHPETSDKRLQEVFQDVISVGALSFLKTVDIIHCAESMDGVKAPEKLRGRDEALRAKQVAESLQLVLDVLRLRVETDPDVVTRIKCLELHHQALSGDLEELSRSVRAVLRSATGGNKDNRAIIPKHIFRTVTQAILAHGRAGSPREALNCILFSWVAMRPHIFSERRGDMAGPMVYLGNVIRTQLFDILVNIRDPAQWYLDRQAEYNPVTLRVMGHLLIKCFHDRSLPFKALEVYEAMESLGIESPPSILALLLRALTDCRALDQARPIYAQFRKLMAKDIKTPFFLNTSMRYFAHKGDHASVHDINELILENNIPSTTDHKTWMMYVHAVNGNLDRVKELFAEYFPPENLLRPRIAHYETIIHAHAVAGDLDGTDRWLKALSQDGHAPNTKIFNDIIRCFARRDEIDSISSIMQQMMSLGIQPNAVTYTTLIHVYGGRRDPVNAERVFKHAMDNDVLPNQEMAMALMQAHADSSSWRGVIRIFDHLRLTRPRSLWLNIEVYNILLRAYVLIGAPFSTVLSLLRNLESSGVVPNEGTYLLVIQSACDARKMDIGQGLLAEMETIKERRAALRSAESFALTMLMGTYLRVGDKESAQYMYEQMEERNILPNSVTFGIIVRAYGNEGTDEGIRLAEDFLTSLIGPEAKAKGWMADPRGSTRALEDVFTPIMVAHGHRLNYEQVEHHFNSLTQMASSPLNITSLNPLLHAYSRVGDIQGVQEVWDQIFGGALSITRARAIPDAETRAVKPTADVKDPREQDPTEDPSTSPSTEPDRSNEVPKIDDNAPRNPPGGTDEEKPSDESEVMLDTLSERSRRSNILCIPLSTYISALSAAGRHTEIAQVWSKVRSHGFGFDAHNWNHLAVALVRAGEPERAFEVLEKVILPYQEYTANAMTARAPVPSNLFSFINMDDEGMPLDPAHPESDTDPSGRITQHTEDIGVGRANPVPRRADAMIATERFAPGRFSLERRDESGRVIVGEDDLAAPLHLFHQQSPAWNMWRPHRLTLHILDTTLRRLSAGRMIRPATHADDAQIPPEADGVGVDQALEMFERINDNYPRAVDAVRQIRKKLRRDEERGVEYKGYRSG